MKQDHIALIDTLRRELGANAVVDNPDALMTYDSDGSVMVKTPPDLVVLPTTPAQIVMAVQHAYRHNIPIVPRGAGTGLSGGGNTDARRHGYWHGADGQSRAGRYSQSPRLSPARRD